MYYKLKKGCFIRKYGEYGYITSTGIYNDQLFNESGAAFLFALSKNAQSLHNIASKIVENFIDVSVDDIIQDVEDFLLHLEEDGFIVSGRTAEECENKDVGFRYEIEPVIKSIEDFSPIHKRTTTGTQELLRKQLLKQPQIGSFQIEITSKCNERCVHCYIPHEYKVDNISPNLFYKTLDELSNMGVINVTLSGGEPMTHPNFIEFLKAAKSYDFNVGVLSNLTLLTDEMVEIMKTGNTSFVQVSLYSMIPEHHDAITTVKGSFEKTKNAILKLIANNIPVQISCPVMSINKNDYVDVAKWAHEHKIRSETDYAIMAEYNHDTSNLVYRLSPNDCEEVITHMLEADEEYQKAIMADDFNATVEKLQNNGDEQFCGIGVSTCCMVSNGDTFPCPGWQSMVCGNLNIDSLENIWKNSPQLNYLRSIRRKDIKECMSCSDKAFCSPCLARFANESPTGNPMEVAKHYCEVAKINKKIVEEWRQRHTIKRDN